MSHPLDGARLKVVRAQKHLDEFNNETYRYFKGDPYLVVSQRKDDGWEMLPAVKLVPPPELSAIIGDSLSCLRAALDYIAWELASRYAGRPVVPPPLGTDKVFFPIFEIWAKYRDNLKRLTKYQIPGDALDVLENVQPYHPGNEPLWWLYLLVNQDKHRLPILIAPSTFGMSVRFTAKEHPTTVLVKDMTTGEVRPLQDGDRPTSVHVPDGVLPPGYTYDDLKMDGQITGFVTFNHPPVPRQPVDLTIEQIIERVAHVIPRFERFF